MGDATSFPFFPAGHFGKDSLDDSVGKAPNDQLVCIESSRSSGDVCAGSNTSLHLLSATQRP